METPQKPTKHTRLQVLSSSEEGNNDCCDQREEVDASQIISQINITADEFQIVESPQSKLQSTPMTDQKLRKELADSANYI